MSDLYEFIGTLRKPDNSGFLAAHTHESVRTSTFPPATLITVEEGIDPGHYAAIGSRVTFNPDVVPNAFYIWAQQGGHQLYQALISDTLILEGLELYVVLTSDAPVTYSLANVTPQIQFLNLFSTFALIYRREDYLYVLEALDEEANKGGVAGAAAMASLMKATKLPDLPTKELVKV